MKFTVNTGYPLSEADSLLNMYPDFKVYIKYRNKLLGVNADITQIAQNPASYADIRADMNEGLLSADKVPIGLSQASYYYCSSEICDMLGIYASFHDIVVDTEKQQMWLIPQYRRKPISFQEQVEETQWYLDAIDWLDEHLN